jgi:alpha-D-ribose 1-methylphosphonate 5-triphosphate diphosphatase
MTADLSVEHDRRAITNARVVTPERVVRNGHVIIDEDRIVDVGTGRVGSSETPIDVGGKLVLPGLVDLHGDDYERHLFPREGARVDTETAVVACDRANVAAGITTKYHAVAFEDGPGDERSVALAEDVIDALTTLEGFLADNRVHARCELCEDRAVDGVLEAVDRDVVDLVSLMNHLPDSGQFDDLAQFNRRYADRTGGSPGDTERTITRRRVSLPEVDDRARRVIRAARAEGIEIASHDDEDERRVEAMWRRGVSISEYPVTMAAARRASQLGMVTTMGAPNLVRGGSLWGNLSASDAIQAGVVDVLCTDYHPPSLLASVFQETGEPLPERVARVTRAPADVVGLDDRGRIEPGARADLVVVDPSSPPQVKRVYVGGSEVYRTPAIAVDGDTDRP